MEAEHRWLDVLLSAVDTAIVERSEALVDVALALWESMMTALGSSLRPRCRRSSPRKVSWTTSMVASSRYLAK